MDIDRFNQLDENTWEIPRHGRMRVSAIIYADRDLIGAMDDKVYQQASNVATLPGIVGHSYAMPDAHWGYGFPIGGVAAFDADEGGVVSAGGVGFDISCGVRCLVTGLTREDVAPQAGALADELFERVPAGIGSTGRIHLDEAGMNAMLGGGARWAVEQGYGKPADLERIEEHGRMPGADPSQVSEKARYRQRNEMGTLGSGNHYLEVQYVDAVYDADVAADFGLRTGDVVVSIHCGSRGLGHQIGTEYLRLMATSARSHGIALPDRELACAPIRSDIGQSYLGAMRAAINCAFANRQIITHLTRQAFEAILPDAGLELLYDVSHNTCKTEIHALEGRERELHVHRKGATRAFGPGHPELPPALRETGQPVLIGGSMGSCSYVLAGTADSERRAFSSACHGAGRAMSRRQARRQWQGRQIVEQLGREGIRIRCPSLRGVSEEAPLAYKDVTAVVDAADHAGLAKKIARLRPMVCVKG